MKAEIRFTNEGAQRLRWLLRQRYQSKAELTKLAKVAIREIASQQAEKMLAELDFSEEADNA